MTDQAQDDRTPASPGEAADRKRSKVFDASLEVATAIVLSFAALVTSWAGYQAGLWDGEQATHYSKANAEHMAATRQSTRAGQLEAVDVMSFAEWANANASGNKALEAFYRARFRPEFRAAFDAWIATRPVENPAAPSSPFVDPKYRHKAEAQAEETERGAAQLFSEGQRANSISDHYGQGSVFLASALFFGGMCQVFRTPKVRLALLAVAAIACAFGAFRIFTLPTLKL